MTEKTRHSDKGGGGSYWRFMAMVSTSTVIMFFLMYANTFTVDDIFWSETRFWMMFVMGGMMMIVMLLFMWGMYKDRTKNFITQPDHRRRHRIYGSDDPASLDRDHDQRTRKPEGS